jgi:hypothetical protein
MDLMRLGLDHNAHLANCIKRCHVILRRGVDEKKFDGKLDIGKS